MKTIILDYDGTIHDCAKIYIPAFRRGYKYLTDNGFMRDRGVPDEEIVDYLGYSPKAMWEDFAPNLLEREREIAAKIISMRMAELVERGESYLYDGAEEALQKLCDSGYRLLLISNCFHSYMETHKQVHDLNRFFDGCYCTEDYGYISKTDIFEFIKRDYHRDSEFLVVGDRRLDLDIAFKNELPCIGCTYGYCKKGELEGATRLIGSISELPEAVASIAAEAQEQLKKEA